VQDKAASSGSSFYYAFSVLPPPRRAAITAFYAFCREVDDVVDEVATRGGRLQAAVVARRSGRAFAGRPTHPVMQALMPWPRSFGIRPTTCWP
jgi:phytoene synthase